MEIFSLWKGGINSLKHNSSKRSEVLNTLLDIENELSLRQNREDFYRFMIYSYLIEVNHYCDVIQVLINFKFLYEVVIQERMLMEKKLGESCSIRDQESENKNS